MILSYVIYTLCIILIIFGGRFAGFNKKFNDDFLDKKYTKSLCGLMTLFIIFHHISQQEAFQYVSKELSIFVNIGYLFVSVFFFCSGYGLTINADKDENYLNNFFKNRILAVFIPFIINNIVFAIYGYINGMPLVRCLLGIVGLVEINDNGWYIFVILILYLVFYLVRKYVKKTPTQLLIYFLTTIMMISIFCINGHFAWWAGRPGWWLTGLDKAKWWMQERVLWFSGEWWVNSSIGFVVGACFASYKEKIVAWLKKGYWLKLAVLVALFVSSFILFKNHHFSDMYWTEFGSVKPGIDKKFLTSLIQFPSSLFFVITVFVIGMKYTFRNPITSFLGNISLETYLYGLIPINVFSFLISSKYDSIVKKPFNYNLIIYLLCVVLSTILIGYVFNKLDNKLVKEIKNKFKK